MEVLGVNARNQDVKMAHTHTRQARAPSEAPLPAHMHTCHSANARSGRYSISMSDNHTP